MENNLLTEKQPELRALQLAEALWNQPDMRKLAEALGYSCRRSDLAAERHIAQQVCCVVLVLSVHRLICTGMQVKMAVHEFKSKVQSNEGRVIYQMLMTIVAPLPGGGGPSLRSILR